MSVVDALIWGTLAAAVAYIAVHVKINKYTGEEDDVMKAALEEFRKKQKQKEKK